jgi:hypothetical protein
MNISRRARIRNPLGWKDSDYICLSVSCGKRYHDGNDFLAILDVAKESGKPIIVDLSDSLQRYNLMACGFSQEKSHELANRQGSLWIEKQAKHLGDVQVIRWDHWLRHPQFCSVRSALSQISKKNGALLQALTSDVSNFTSRQRFLAPNTAYYSQKFILEEAAAEILLGRAFPCSRLYPGNELETLRVIREGLVPEAPQGLQNTKYYKFTLETRKIVMRPDGSGSLPQSLSVFANDPRLNNEGYLVRTG